MSISPARPVPLRTLEMAVFLNVQKTADLLMGELAQLLRPHGLSPTQYNVLRILRAAGPEGLPIGRITERMLTREPDMTRLLDRLESRKLLERSRDVKDRRVVRARITRAGRDVLEQLDAPILQLHRQQLGRLGRERLRSLGVLLDAARQRTE